MRIQSTFWVAISMAMVFMIPCARSETYFYSDAVIQEGDYYGDDWPNRVEIYDTPPDTTTIDMTGGFVDWLITYNSSVLNLSDGVIGSKLIAEESSVMNISGGTMSDVSSNDSSTVNITGGDINWLFAGEKVNIYSGNIGELYAGHGGEANIYGLNLFATDVGGSYGYGYITGNWVGGAAFNIDLSNELAYSRLNLYEIPEPTTAVLLGLGGLALLRKRRV